MLINQFLGHPIEREYESWIGSQIELYFRNLGFDVPFVAVSPKDEASWPADDWFDADGLVIGLQVKRPYLRGRNEDDKSDDEIGRTCTMQDIYWKFELSGDVLENRLRQITQIQSCPEIFYCLPTFISRNYRSNSLHHCVFWRPEVSASPPPQIGWYGKNPNEDRANARDAVGDLGSRWRWGKLLEELQAGRVREVQEEIAIHLGTGNDAESPVMKTREKLLKWSERSYSLSFDDDETFCFFRLPAEVAPCLS